ncbi:MAG TPA: ATP-binding protein [Pseudonocardia sp.]|jgi:serine/threonine-protein kinase RsbW|nr:ATP-binding protein [Pseudonocardia sp.]
MTLTPAMGKHGQIEIRVDATAWMVPFVRTMAAEVAARADFDLDAISDLRMAVDEACAALIGDAADGGELRCVFAVDRDRIQVRVTVPPGRPGAVFDTTGFGWQVLRTLVDEIVTLPATSTDTAGPPDGADSVLGIRFVKKALVG